MSNKRKRSAHIAAICIVYFIVMICDIQLTYAKGETKSSTEADIYSNIDDYLQIKTKCYFQETMGNVKTMIRHFSSARSASHLRRSALCSWSSNKRLT